MNTNKLSKILKALSNPNRLELYLEIMEKSEISNKIGCECFLSDIIRSLKIGAPTISHHLKELSNAELVITERRGKYVVVKINKPILDKVREKLFLLK